MNLRNFTYLLIHAVIIIGCKGPGLMVYKEFSKIEQLEIPKLLHLESNNKEILYFGTYHSNDITDTIFKFIRTKFVEFQPNYVLYEGNNWPIYNNIDSTILASGEPGYIIKLSQNNDLKCSSIEPKEKDEYNFLLKKYDFNWVVLMYMCRQIDQQKRLAQTHKITDKEFKKNMNYFFQMLADKGVPLKGEQLDYIYWKNTYREMLKEDLDWKKFNPAMYYPNYYLTKLNEINRTSDKFRNEYMVEEILSKSEEHDKLMILLGGGHLIIQEKLLQYKFKKKYN